MRARCRQGITILMYHKVLPSPLRAQYPLQNLVVEETVFKLQMEWLSKRFRVLTVAEAMECLDKNDLSGSAPYDLPIACITFDDGYYDNYKYAVPILESHGLKATFYVATGFISGRGLWYDRMAAAWRTDPAAAAQGATRIIPGLRDRIAGISELDDWIGLLKGIPDETRRRVMDEIKVPQMEMGTIFGAMSPEQLSDLSLRGHEIGSHTVTHPILTQLDSAAIRHELDESLHDLEKWITHRPVGLCYPNGDHDDSVIATAREVGFRYACSVRRGMVDASSDKLSLPRRSIYSSDNEKSAALEFESEVVGWHDLLRRSMGQVLAALRRPQ